MVRQSNYNLNMSIIARGIWRKRRNFDAFQIFTVR